jgi:hypothetical protein
MNDPALSLLLSDAYGAPVMIVEGSVVTAANAAAAAVLGPGARPGAAVDALFDERSRRKLAVAGAAGTLELQALRRGRDPLTVRFLAQPLGTGTLLVATSVGLEYTDRMEHQLLGTNAELVNMTRRL